MFYLMAAVMLVMAVISFRYNKILFAIELTLAILAACTVAVSDIMLRKNISTALKSARKVLAVDDNFTLEDFSLPVAVVAPYGDIVWGNKQFRQSFSEDTPVMGENILKYIYPKTLRQIMGDNGTSISYKGREYTVYGTMTKDSFIMYFVDNTFYKAIHKEYREKKPVVCMAVFDNREEISRGSASGEESRISSEVEAVVRDWGIQEMGGFMKRLSDGRYLVVTDESHVETVKKKRFQVLDSVRKIKSASKMSATISIGVGRGASDIAESERWARQALDMALGRGGDQVAVMQNGDAYEFFGGLSKGVEKRDKVRTRVIAATISDHVRESDKIYVMGHKNSDLDSVGAAVGMWAVIHKGIEKPVQIVLNRHQTLAGQLVERMEETYPGEHIFVTPQHAMQEATERSLLIVVDTHSINFVESREMLEKIPKVIVIDHHRMMVTHIKNALIFYHEPYASSASEMVTEIVQYIRSSAIDPVDAQALLAGIMLDTKSFVLKTGVRTFEASAFLRRRGADTVEVKKLFSNTLETYKEKSQLVSSSEIYKGCAIATSNFEVEDMRVAAAQAADELLSIQGVIASFVLYRSGSDINISARSLGDVNVQLLLEEFGGGGHFTMAGAQMKDIMMGDAKRLLMKELDSKLSHVTVQDARDE